jgi:hypothetical protein
MYLDRQSHRNLISSQRYTPSQDYLDMRQKLENRPKGVGAIPNREFIRILKLTHKKLSNIAYAFQVAKKTNRRVLDVQNGIIRLTA